MTTIDSAEDYSEEASFIESFRIQRRVIGALILREVKTRFWKNKLGYLWVLVEPCLHLIVLTSIAVYIREVGAPLGFTPLESIASGVLPFFLYRGITGFLTNSILANQAMLRYPLVKIVDVILARFFLESICEVGSGTIIFCALIGIGWFPLPRDPLGLVPPYCALALLGLGVGSCFAVWSAVSNTAMNFIIVFMMFVYMTSGIFFIGTNLPVPIEKFMAYNPIYNCLTLFRESYFYNVRNPFVTIWYPLAFALGLIVLALAMIRVLRGRLTEIP